MAEEPRYLAPFRQRDFQISCAAVSFVMLLLLMCLFAGLLIRFGNDDDDPNDSFVERVPNTPTALAQPTAVGLASSPTPTPFTAAATLIPTPTPLILAPGSGFIPGGFPTPAPVPFDPFVPAAPPPVVVPIIPSEPPPVMPAEPPPDVAGREGSHRDFRITLVRRGTDSLFLVNRTRDRALPLAPLRVGDGEGAVEGSEWKVKNLKPGECVTVWKAGDNAKAPDVDCAEVGKQLKRKGSERFWGSDFNVYYQDVLLGRCAQDKCSFTISD